MEDVPTAMRVATSGRYATTGAAVPHPLVDAHVASLF
jgi:hypothetical protein